MGPANTDRFPSHLLSMRVFRPAGGRLDLTLFVRFNPLTFMKPALLPPWLSHSSAIVRYAAGVLSVLLAVNEGLSFANGAVEKSHL